LAPETAVRTERVVVNPPGFRQNLRFLKPVKQLAVLKLLSHLAIENIYEAIVIGSDIGGAIMGCRAFSLRITFSRETPRETRSLTATRGKIPAEHNVSWATFLVCGRDS